MKISPKEILIKSENNVYNLFIKGNELKTPNKNKFDIKNKKIIALLKNEISSQQYLNLKEITYYKIFSLAIDKIRINKIVFVNNLTEYAKIDLICYWESSPKELFLLQEKKWKKIFDILKFQQLDFEFTTSITPIKQKQSTLSLFRKKILNLTEIELSCLMTITQMSGSVLLGYLFIDGKLSSANLFDNCFLHCEWQSNKWGIIKEEQDKRKKDLIAFKKIHKLIDMINNV